MHNLRLRTSGAMHYNILAFRNVFPVEQPVTCTGDVQATALPSIDIHWRFYCGAMLLTLEMWELRFRQCLAHVVPSSMLTLVLVLSLCDAFACRIQWHAESLLTCFLVHSIRDAQPLTARK